MFIHFWKVWSFFPLVFKISNFFLKLLQFLFAIDGDSMFDL